MKFVFPLRVGHEWWRQKWASSDLFSPETKKKISVKIISTNKVNKVGRESDHVSGYTSIFINSRIKGIFTTSNRSNKSNNLMA